MSRVLWKFSPVDSWFFRGGSPFSWGQSIGINDVVFPPPMTVLQGAIRTAIARKRGWQPHRDDLWPSELGDPEHLGYLTFKGPVMTRQGASFFPWPRHILEDAKGLVNLVPGPKIHSDLGERQLPVPTRKEDNLHALDPYWIEAEGLARVLRGGLPEADQMKPAKEFWKFEPRTHLAINQATATAEEGRLFHTVQTRLQPDVSIAVEVDGLPADWQSNIDFIQLGGEGRFARVETEEHARLQVPALADLQSQEGVYHIFALLLTPAVFQQGEKVLRDGPLADLQCVSAVTGRAEMRGGWDLKNRRPRPLRAFVPAGSVWFYQMSPAEWERRKPLHGQHVGLDSEYGYGHLVFGQWTEDGRQATKEGR